MQSDGQPNLRTLVIPMKKNTKSKPFKDFMTTTNNNNYIGSHNRNHTNIIDSCILEVDEEDDANSVIDHPVSRRAANRTGHFSLFDYSNKCKEFSILLTAKNCQLLNFYRSILEPYIESYWLTANRLTKIQSNAKNDNSTIDMATLMSGLLDDGQRMLQNGQLHYGMFTTRKYCLTNIYFGF